MSVRYCFHSPTTMKQTGSLKTHLSEWKFLNYFFFSQLHQLFLPLFISHCCLKLVKDWRKTYLARYCARAVKGRSYIIIWVNFWKSRDKKEGLVGIVWMEKWGGSNLSTDGSCSLAYLYQPALLSKRSDKS